MDFIVRGIEPYAVQKIDELAKKASLSRNEYLKIYLERLAAMDSLNEIESKYEQLTKFIANIVNENTIMLEKVRQYLETEEST